MKIILENREPGQTYFLDAGLPRLRVSTLIPIRFSISSNQAIAERLQLVDLLPFLKVCEVVLKVAALDEHRLAVMAALRNIAKINLSQFSLDHHQPRDCEERLPVLCRQSNGRSHFLNPGEPLLIVDGPLSRIPFSIRVFLASSG